MAATTDTVEVPRDLLAWLVWAAWSAELEFARGALNPAEPAFAHQFVRDALERFDDAESVPDRFTLLETADKELAEREKAMRDEFGVDRWFADDTAGADGQ